VALEGLVHGEVGRCRDPAPWIGGFKFQHLQWHRVSVRVWRRRRAAWLRHTLSRPFSPPHAIHPCSLFQLTTRCFTPFGMAICAKQGASLKTQIDVRASRRGCERGTELCLLREIDEHGSALAGLPSTERELRLRRGGSGVKLPLPDAAVATIVEKKDQHPLIGIAKQAQRPKAEPTRRKVSG